MSYESGMLHDLAMPGRERVEQALLRALLMHGGTLLEFGAGQEVVDELADDFGLNVDQRTASLQTVYRKENRVKKSPLWHRLLFRAADSLARNHLVSRPSRTFRLTGKREWMLTEDGFDQALRTCKIPRARKNSLSVRSYDVQKIARRLMESRRPVNYSPIDTEKRVITTTREALLRIRGFRQAVIQAYGYTCAVCGLKVNSPDRLSWEVEAAHIVPHHSMGRDDIWNGIALCHLHHWAFDVGWFSLRDDYAVEVSSRVGSLPKDYGRLGDYEFITALSRRPERILLPSNSEIQPHQNAIRWHRQNVFRRDEDQRV